MQTDFPLIFEDNHLLVVNKPAGLPTQPDDTGQSSMEEWTKGWLKEKYHKPGNVFLGIVHRLDKPVSGIVIFAKTSKALSRLNTSIRAKATHKLYYALIDHDLPAKEGILENYLVHDDFRARVVSAKEPYAKLALLKYKTIEKIESRTLVEVELETGRYHQIRAQLAYAGCPICGDSKYGSQTPFYGRVALHHARLQIPHPITGEIRTFEAPLGKEFR